MRNKPIKLLLIKASIGCFLTVLTSGFLAEVKAEEYRDHVPSPTINNVSYGPHERNVMDVWQAKGNGPRPVVVYIHSGGWTEGSKERLGWFIQPQPLLDAGISVVAINYRLIPRQSNTPSVIEVTKPPLVHQPLYDAKRALQFVRHKAKEWNIDTTRVGLAGGSAGGCTSLWLAFHDEMADSKSEDPVLRQSTRVSCVAVTAAQTTLDPVVARQWIPDLQYGAHAFGLSSVDAAIKHRQKIDPWVREYSPFGHLTKDDPPVYLSYMKAPQLGKGGGDATHSSNYGAGLAALCEKIGVPCELFYQGVTSPKHYSVSAFLVAKMADQ